MLEPKDIQVGKTYRAKRPQRQWGEVVNDRYVLYVSPNGENVQYDSQTVRLGARFPTVSMEQFLKWAKNELPTPPQSDATTAAMGTTSNQENENG